VKFYLDKVAEFEIASLYRHFDQNQKQHITKEEFVSAFKRDVKETVFQIGIEDIIKPLAFKVRLYNVNESLLFDKIDKDRNGKLSAEEMRRMFKADFNIELVDEEVQVLR